MRTIIANVYAETDYNVFKKLALNRATTEYHIVEVMESMEEHEILNPIIVNEKMEIIEGQHRYEALKRLKRPIKYIMEPGATIDDCRRLNDNNKNWNLMTYAKSYAEEGNENYIRIIETAKETGLSIQTIGLILGRSFTWKGQQTYFKQGLIKFTDEDKQSVLFVKKKTDEILDALQLTSASKTIYSATRVIVSYEGYNHDRMLAKCRKYRLRFVATARLEEQLRYFSDIYNANAKSGRLYFEDYMRNKGANVRNYDTRVSDEDASSLEVIK